MDYTTYIDIELGYIPLRRCCMICNNFVINPYKSNKLCSKKCYDVRNIAIDSDEYDNDKNIMKNCLYCKKQTAYIDYHNCYNK